MKFESSRAMNDDKAARLALPRMSLRRCSFLPEAPASEREPASKSGPQ